jgi:hypothetical protein
MLRESCMQDSPAAGYASGYCPVLVILYLIRMNNADSGYHSQTGWLDPSWSGCQLRRANGR